MKNAVFTLIMGALFSSVLIFLSTKGYTKIYPRFSDHGPWLGVAGFFILLIIDDTWFYWWHRLLHHPVLFRYVHVVHHQSINVDPFTSMSFFLAKAFILTIWILPVALYIPIDAPVLFLVQIWGLLDNIKAHLGFEIYPVWFHKSWLRFLTTSTHHNMHQSKFKGNYGVHFRIWDRLVGSEFKDYEAEFNKAQKRKSHPERKYPYIMVRLWNEIPDLSPAFLFNRNGFYIACLNKFVY